MVNKNKKSTLEAEFSTCTVIKDASGNFRIIPKAESVVEQTQPQSIEKDVKSKVPRDKKVGLDQTDTDYTEYTPDSKRGSGGSDSKVVPRSKGDSGVDGQPKTSFEKEVADDSTSGNPDDYVQTYQENVKPTPAGKAGNHVASDDKDVVIAQLREELKREQTLRKREKVARKIVNFQVQAGLLDSNDEDMIEKAIEERLSTPTEVLKRELELNKNLISKLSSQTKTASVEGVKVGTFNNLYKVASYSVQDVVDTNSIQSCFYNREIANDREGGNYAPSLPEPKTASSNLKDVMSQSTRLGQITSEVPKKNKN